MPSKPAPISTQPRPRTPLSLPSSSSVAPGLSQQTSPSVQAPEASERRGTGALGHLPAIASTRQARDSLPPPPLLELGQYLEIRGGRSANLVIGCGTTPEQVVMGSGKQTMQGTPCPFGTDHHNDFTVDVSEQAQANLTLDFAEYKSSVLHAQGKGKFDQVTFENLSRGPRNPFTKTEVERWIEGADALLKPSGKLSFHNGHKPYRDHAQAAMEARGYAVTVEGMKCEGVKPASILSTLTNWLKG